MSSDVVGRGRDNTGGSKCTIFIYTSAVTGTLSAHMTNKRQDVRNSETSNFAVKLAVLLITS